MIGLVLLGFILVFVFFSVLVICEDVMEKSFRKKGFIEMGVMYQFLLSIVLVFVSANTFAAFDCVGTVTKVLIHANGDVVTEMSWNPETNMTVCSLKQELNNVDVTTCALWSGLLLSAKERGKATLVFNYSANTDDCADVSSSELNYIGESNAKASRRRR